MTPSFALTIDQIADNEYPEKHGFDPFTEPKTLIIPLDGENLIGLFNSGQMIINESDTSVVKIVRDEPGS